MNANCAIAQSSLNISLETFSIYLEGDCILFFLMFMCNKKMLCWLFRKIHVFNWFKFVLVNTKIHRDLCHYTHHDKLFESMGLSIKVLWTYKARKVMLYCGICLMPLVYVHHFPHFFVHFNTHSSNIRIVVWKEDFFFTLIM